MRLGVRQYASVVAVLAALLSASLMLVSILQSNWYARENDSQCGMSFSKPRYRRLALEPKRNHPQPHYALYDYTDGFARFTRSHETSSLSIIVFLPGNSGSYKQFRSIASRIVRKINKKLMTDAVEQYTFDFGEESSALSATSLENQGAFVARQIYLLIEAKMRTLFLDRSEISIILIGHSMGGLVAASAFGYDKFPGDLVTALYVLGAPIRGPVLTTELALDRFYLNMRKLWMQPSPSSTTRGSIHVDPMVVSISGGMGDLLVESALSDVHGVVLGTNVLSTVAAQIPSVTISVEHQVLVWCSELVDVIASSVVEMLDLDAESAAVRTSRRPARALAERNRFMFEWRDALHSLVNSPLVSAASRIPHLGEQLQFRETFTNETSPFFLLRLPSSAEKFKIATIYIDFEPETMEQCSLAGVCKAAESMASISLLYSASQRNTSHLLPRHLFVFNSSHFAGADCFRIFPRRSTIRFRRSYHAWGSLQQTNIRRFQHWGKFVLRNESVVAFAVSDSLQTDLFFDVRIQQLFCDGATFTAPVVLASSNTKGTYQGAEVVGEGDQTLRFFRSSSITKGIEALFILDPMCSYQIEMVPLWFPSFLTTLFHDLAVFPQLLMSILLMVMAIQLYTSEASFRGMKDVILRDAPEIIIICAVVALTLPTVMELRMPHRMGGNSSAVPLPTSKSIWSLFASSVVSIVAIESIVSFFVDRLVHLQRPRSWPWSWTRLLRRHHFISIALLLSLLLRPAFYSIFASLSTLLYFVYCCLKLPQYGPIYVSWLVLHFCLLPSCLPRWTSYATPSPMSLSPSHMASFMLFVLSNWTFVATASTATSDLYRIHALLLACLGVVVLLWSPRSIAVFSFITFSVWCLGLSSLLFPQRSLRQIKHE